MSSSNAREQLSDHLILQDYLNSLFGVSSFKEFKDRLQPRNGPPVTDGFDDEGRSYIFYDLKSRISNIKIPLEKLEEYDTHIGNYVKKLNERRERPVVLKYFQYLAALYTEVYLDNFFSDPIGLLNELNHFASSVKKNDIFFSRHDMNKLAFWMATGSGKTLLMHINVMQFQRYNIGAHRMDFDNILLITPSETLSKQHIEEMEQSSIPCALFHDLSRGLLFDKVQGDIIKVLDIHKLTEEKTGAGVTIDIEEFGSNNLVFVDEGHKGTGGTKWRKFREFVAQEGFTFEYSATFGQAIAATSARDATDLLEEYGKSILFDYSYPYFYNDGYGKDYRIINLKRDVYSKEKDVLLCANALAFYEQMLLFDDLSELVTEYNIDPPLWIFVGSKVKGKRSDSDILEVVKFLEKLIRNSDNWSVKTIQRILEGNSDLLDNQNRDIFSPSYPDRKLQYLRDKGFDAESLYKDMLQRVFHLSSPCQLQLVNLKGIEGEIGLRGSVQEEFFGVINIGDESSFLKLAKEKGGFKRFDHDFSHSLFQEIEGPESKVNILVGAKKFIEGWNSWRVSNMGLLNIGKKEGSQIIQLFGRGVRLRGKDFCLKRSSVLEQLPPKYLSILETLNIFGLNANYMERFKDYLHLEGIEDGTKVEFSLGIDLNQEFLNKGLVVPKIDFTRFKKEEFFTVTGKEDLTVTVDLNPRAEELTSLEEQETGTDISNSPRSIASELLGLLDWDSIYFQLLEYKREHDLSNMVFTKQVLKTILHRDCYTLFCPDVFVNPSNFADLKHVERCAVAILKKYISQVCRRHSNLWAQKNYEIAKLSASHGNLNFNKFTFMVKESDQVTLSEIKQLIEEKLELVRKGDFSSAHIKNVYFDRHLYQPLFADPKPIFITPPGLNDGEQCFVKDLKEFLLNNSALFDGKELFLLRNLSKRGIGFSASNWYYPDFIIWVKAKNKQNLIFVEPHSLAWTERPWEDEKILLAQNIKHIEEQLNKKLRNLALVLDAFMLSVTNYEDVKENFKNESREKLEQKHVLFQRDDPNYIDKIFRVVENT